MLKLNKKEALEDLKRRVETSLDILDAANHSAKDHDADVVNLDFVMKKLEEYILRIDLNLAREPGK